MDGLGYLGCIDEKSILFDLAFVDTAFHQNVASISPARSPRVAYNPVVDSVQSAVSNDNDSMGYL